MARGRRTGLRIALLVGLCLAWTPADAVRYHVRSETIGDAYQLVRADDEVLNRRRIHQYLGLGAYDLLTSEEHRLNLVTLFRFDADFGITEEELDAVRTLRREQLSIQQAYVEGRDLGGVVDFRLGRQIHYDPIDFLMLDGLVATVSTPWHVGVEVQAGLEAGNRLGDVTTSQLELDGVRLIDGVQERDRPKWVLGAALVTTDLLWTRARLGYRRIFSGGEVNQEKIGAGFTQRVAGALHLDGAVSYDLFSEAFDRIRAGASWRITPAWEVEAQYVRTVPTFDADSIFNIFATWPLNDVNGRVRWRLGRDRSVYAGGMVRLFQNEDWPDAEEDTATGDVDDAVTATGAMAGYVHGFGERGSVSVDLSWEDGYGGQRGLLDVWGRWAVLPGVVELDGRLTGIRIEDGLQERLEAWGGGYQLGGRWLVGERASIQAMLEHNFNRLRPSQVRFFVVADVNLWL
ncbi:MAG: hypothetical protein ACQEXJ_08495 [Myxococcota bacterium]